jgi:hypothetical protein
MPTTQTPTPLMTEPEPLEDGTQPTDDVTGCVRVGVNGFGRIGRMVVRILIGRYPTYRIMHINSTQASTGLQPTRAPRSVGQTRENTRLVVSHSLPTT